MSAFTRGIALWLLPAALSTVFVALFAAANPVIEQWVSLLNPKLILDYISIPCDISWTMMLALVGRSSMCDGGAGRFSPRRLPMAPCRPRCRPKSRRLLGPSTILRSLLLFNLVFAVQSASTDLSLGQCSAAGRHHLCVLRPSRRLRPDRHRAARGRLRSRGDAPGRAGREIKVIRPLVYLWVAQNVLLVASSILRLDLYVTSTC